MRDFEAIHETDLFVKIYLLARSHKLPRWWYRLVFPMVTGADIKEPLSEELEKMCPALTVND